MRPLRVCLDARLDYGQAGGVEQFIIGLAHGLREVARGGERYSFLAWSDAADWLAPFAGGAVDIVTLPREPWRAGGRRVAEAMPRSLRRVLDRHVVPYALAHRHERSDGTIERLGFDVVHFTRQVAFETAMPSVYHPHDLQHIHLPGYFTAAERHFRSVVYRRYARQARVVVATSTWCRDDFVRHLGIPAEKVRVVPLAPVTAAYAEPTAAEIAAMRQRVPDDFLFYPAQTWPHKNHVALIDAVAALRQRGVVVPLVFSGRANEWRAAIEQRARERGVDGQVTFTGFVTPAELQVLYRLARAVAIPTLFEAASFPLWEAWLAERAVACSAITSLPEQAGDAALLFDPRDPASVADTVERLWTDAALRDVLVARGRARVRLFTWGETARRMRACYRLAAGHELNDDDRQLLDAPPLL